MGTWKKMNKAIMKAFQPENITEYKQRLGFDTGTKNVLIVEQLPTIGEKIVNILFKRGYHHYKGYIISLEESGILLMKLNYLNTQFNNENKFIEPEDFNDLRLKKHWLSDTLILKSNKGDYKFMISVKTIVKQYPYHTETLKHLDELINQYSD